MKTKRVIELLTAEINRQMALAQSASDLKIYAAHMEVAEALILAKHCTAEVMESEEK